MSSLPFKKRLRFLVPEHTYYGGLIREKGFMTKLGLHGRGVRIWTFLGPNRKLMEKGVFEGGVLVQGEEIWKDYNTRTFQTIQVDTKVNPLNIETLLNRMTYVMQVTGC